MESVKAKKRPIPDQLRSEWRMLLIVIIVGFLINGCTDPEPKVYRVGVVCGADLFLPVIDGLKSKMAELGFKEGETIVYEIYSFNNDPEGERRAAETLVAEKVDLIVTVPTQPSVKAHRAIQGTDIPLVFSYAGIEGIGLVESVPRPGGNVTGVRFPGPEQICKRLELMQAFLPKVRRVWIGYNQNYPTIGPALQALRILSASMGITLVEAPVTTLRELEWDLERRAREADPGLDAIILMPDTFNHSSAGWEVIRTVAKKHKIPIGGSFFYTAEQGALYCNGNEMVTVGELTAPLVSKVLNGTPAGMIPVVSPEQVLTINLTVARELGVEVPRGLLSMASQIIR
ncbi:ABC transporter substrate-binding protein [Desulfosarcina variabilis]|uniref:ABC transporter substrate-binding protein n=1 Tax=Desulfosarcina variabilis TaxID=2300 RepID=UPI003AFA6BBC